MTIPPKKFLLCRPIKKPPVRSVCEGEERRKILFKVGVKLLGPGDYAVLSPAVRTVGVGVFVEGADFFAVIYDHAEVGGGDQHQIGIAVGGSDLDGLSFEIFRDAHGYGGVDGFVLFARCIYAYAAPLLFYDQPFIFHVEKIRLREEPQLKRFLFHRRKSPSFCRRIFMPLHIYAVAFMPSHIYATVFMPLPFNGTDKQHRNKTHSLRFMCFCRCYSVSTIGLVRFDVAALNPAAAFIRLRISGILHCNLCPCKDARLCVVHSVGTHLFQL